jgi:hypothetical protein
MYNRTLWLNTKKEIFFLSQSQGDDSSPPPLSPLIFFEGDNVSAGPESL